MPRIACLHTATSNIAVFDDALRGLHPDGPGQPAAVLTHEVRADLLAAAEQAGGPTDEILRQTAGVLLGLCGGADAVLLTCSTLGPAVGSVLGAPVPVLRVDAALAAQAVRGGGRVVALCAVETTMEPTRRMFEAACGATGAEVEVRLIPGAWAAFRAGNHAAYLTLVARAADDAARGGARVALAQASMAGAAALAGSAPLTSPAAGLTAAIAAARAGVGR